MAKIASPTKVRRRLHSVPVAFGLMVLFIALLLTNKTIGL